MNQNRSNINSKNQLIQLNQLSTNNSKSLTEVKITKKCSVASLMASIMEDVEKVENSFSFKKNYSNKNSIFSFQGSKSPLIKNELKNDMNNMNNMNNINNIKSKFHTPILPNKIFKYNTQLFQKKLILLNEKEENTPPNKKRISLDLSFSEISKVPQCNLSSKILCLIC